MAAAGCGGPLPAPLMPATGWAGRKLASTEAGGGGGDQGRRHNVENAHRPAVDVGSAPVRIPAIRIWPFCTAWLAGLWCISGSAGGGWPHVQRRQSVQAVYVQLLGICEHRVLLFLCFLGSLLCQF